ncbi:hypothetical protein [Sphingomonas sp. R1]|uniref:hypothetical protein n=1 Tax=Sphingomonas sp. R1 TaxID=399176 RepID=UPI002224008A|nr:hypothetical protein [Sphingomonas sp. R1]UYY77700.1 hypothetical protein OIM94_01430 [Sphingomonas sp. R1]
MATAPKPLAALSAGLLARKGRVRLPVPAMPPEAAALHLARTARATKGKAAFTLRLDAERRLRLRLAAAVSGRSAQQLVTEAIDTMLADMAGLELLVHQIDAGEE